MDVVMLYPTFQMKLLSVVVFDLVKEPDKFLAWLCSFSTF